MRCRVLLIALVVCLVAQTTTLAIDFAGGTGEPNDPYQIATTEQLVALGTDSSLFDKHFVLVDDIDLSVEAPGSRLFDSAVIAPSAADDYFGPGFVDRPFRGTFNGQGHAIRGLQINSAGTGNDYLGLFGALGPEAVVRDVVLEDVIVSATMHSGNIGTLAGANAGTILGCHVTGDVAYGEQDGDEPVGGLVGINEGIIARCHVMSSVLVTCYSYGATGGLAGYNTGLIWQCEVTTDVWVEWTEGPVGGVVGNNVGAIIQCCAAGEIDAGGSGSHSGLAATNLGSVIQSYATSDLHGGGSGSNGGVVGFNYGSVTQCYAMGKVSAPSWADAGGLVARNQGVVSQSFWDRETTGQATSAGGTGLSTAQMQKASTFRNAGWDWLGERANGTCEVWTTPEDQGEYPLLVWDSDVPQSPEFPGSGTPDDPYQIATAEDLGAMNHADAMAHYALTADIDLSGITWPGAVVPLIGGSLDGAGLAISNLTIQNGGHAGLLGSIRKGAQVNNLGIESAEIVCADATKCVGILAATNAGHIARCYTTGNITGEDIVGGLVASNGGIVSECFSTAVVSGTSQLGGLLGFNSDTLRHSYASGTVTGKNAMGGLVGKNTKAITQCYSTGKVSGQWDTGAVVGVSNVPTSQCYYVLGACRQDAGGAKPLTTNQMKFQSNFTDWDFDTIWSICEEQDYPRLQWEGISCEE